MFDIIAIEQAYVISTGYNIKPNIGCKRKWIKRACPHYEEIDACLIKITSKLGDILTYAKVNGIDPTVDFVLLELEKNREYDLRPNRVDMFDALERYIVEKAPSVSADQIKDYRTPCKHLTAFKEYSSQPRNIPQLESDILQRVYGLSIW
ncbi:hypothetical protein [Bacteroides thetaiotaomicron]|uniref:hypothetical protein n=1 Tax=Bacteroides thetaiotaomicron TaxID=818 RepID=UPI002166686B|nr:hypothetical protein [Bacteroides thetaiotaomicron]MCS2207880.1 hypothetical protein [Bacteroides thetaiotaomicron]